MSDLSEKKCLPCKGGMQPLSWEKIEQLHKEFPEWALGIVGDRKAQDIEGLFCFDNFQQALKFFNQVAELAEQENHHPDMAINSYRNVRIRLTTHAAKGLTENDFIMAAKINKLKGE